MNFFKIAIIQDEQDNILDEIKQFKASRKLLLCAAIELSKQLEEQCRIELASIMHQKLLPHLELLMDESEEIRSNSFSELTIYLQIHEFMMTPRKFANLEKYFQHCHNLHGGNISWTLVFSPEERHKHANSRIQSNAKFY